MELHDKAPRKPWLLMVVMAVVIAVIGGWTGCVEPTLQQGVQTITGSISVTTTNIADVRVGFFFRDYWFTTDGTANAPVAAEIATRTIIDTTYYVGRSFYEPLNVEDGSSGTYSITIPTNASQIGSLIAWVDDNPYTSGLADSDLPDIFDAKIAPREYLGVLPAPPSFTQPEPGFFPRYSNGGDITGLLIEYFEPSPFDDGLGINFYADDETGGLANTYRSLNDEDLDSDFIVDGFDFVLP